MTDQWHLLTAETDALVAIWDYRAAVVEFDDTACSAEERNQFVREVADAFGVGLA